MDKSPDAFRTIGEVAEWLDTPAHVLRFWESKFQQVRPVKRAGGRRYYRPGDMRLLGGIKCLLHERGMTIRGVQKLLREEGVAHVAAHAPAMMGAPDDAAAGAPVEGNVVPLRAARGAEAEMTDEQASPTGGAAADDAAADAPEGAARTPDSVPAPPGSEESAAPPAPMEGPAHSPDPSEAGEAAEEDAAAGDGAAAPATEPGTDRTDRDSARPPPDGETPETGPQTAAAAVSAAEAAGTAGPDRLTDAAEAGEAAEEGAAAGDSAAAPATEPGTDRTDRDSARPPPDGETPDTGPQTAAADTAGPDGLSDRPEPAAAERAADDTVSAPASAASPGTDHAPAPQPPDGAEAGEAGAAQADLFAPRDAPAAPPDDDPTLEDIVLPAPPITTRLRDPATRRTLQRDHRGELAALLPRLRELAARIGRAGGD